MNKIVYIFIIFMIFSSLGELTTYRVYVDKEFGFFGVQANTTNFTNYQNRTLNINIGDTVEWENYVLSDERVTIVSDNRLWNDYSAILGWNYKIFSYTFNKSGNYRVHIKENTIYNPPDDLSNYTDELTPWFKFQSTVSTRYMTIIVGKNISNKTQVIPKKKNKIIVNSTYSPRIYDEPEDEEIIPIFTPKIEEKISPYKNYTILEFIKSIINIK